jgi:hypothetical protein
MILMNVVIAAVFARPTVRVCSIGIHEPPAPGLQGFTCCRSNWETISSSAVSALKLHSLRVHSST